MVDTIPAELNEEFPARQPARETLAEDLHIRHVVAVLSHEFRTPLAAIRSAVELAAMPGASDAEWAIDIVDRQSAYLVRLVDALLETSRLTLGKERLNRCRCDASAIIQCAIEAAQPLIFARCHELTTEYHGDLKIHADPARLQQIVVNLLTNAAKYTPAGGHIWLHACRSGAELIIFVRDTGIGIPRDRLGSIFDLFSQEERSLHRSQGGLGVGLTIVRCLAELHGGSVTAESEGTGKGSKFTVTLPARVERLD